MISMWNLLSQSVMMALEGNGTNSQDKSVQVYLLLYLYNVYRLIKPQSASCREGREICLLSCLWFWLPRGIVGPLWLTNGLQSTVAQGTLEQWLHWRRGSGEGGKWAGRKSGLIPVVDASEGDGATQCSTNGLTNGSKTDKKHVRFVIPAFIP